MEEEERRRTGEGLGQEGLEGRLGGRRKEDGRGGAGRMAGWKVGWLVVMAGRWEGGGRWRVDRWSVGRIKGRKRREEKRCEVRSEMRQEGGKG